jgi:hypothetical protein
MATAKIEKHELNIFGVTNANWRGGNTFDLEIVIEEVTAEYVTYRRCQTSEGRTIGGRETARKDHEMYAVLIKLHEAIQALASWWAC